MSALCMFRIRSIVIIGLFLILTHPVSLIIVPIKEVRLVGCLLFLGSKLLLVRIQLLLVLMLVHQLRGSCLAAARPTLAFCTGLTWRGDSGTAAFLTGASFFVTGFVIAALAFLIGRRLGLESPPVSTPFLASEGACLFFCSFLAGAAALDAAIFLAWAFWAVAVFLAGACSPGVARLRFRSLGPVVSLKRTSLGWVPPAGSSKPAMIDLSRGIDFSEITAVRKEWGNQFLPFFCVRIPNSTSALKSRLGRCF